MTGIVLKILAVVMTGVVVHRCVMVILNMDLKKSGRMYFRDAGFGLCYAFLCVLSIGAVLHIFQAGAGNTVEDWILMTLGDWGWLFASSGLILFDRRCRRDRAKALEGGTTFNKQAGYSGEEHHTGYSG